jgi:hypothetical protein
MTIRGAIRSGCELLWVFGSVSGVCGCDTAIDPGSFVPDDVVEPSTDQTQLPDPPAPLRAEGIRIDHPRGTVAFTPPHTCGAGRCGPWLRVSGVVSQWTEGPLGVSLLNPAGLQVYSTTARLLPDVVAGEIPARAWLADVPLPAAGFHHHRVAVSRHDFEAQVTLLDEQIPQLDPDQREPCDSSSCGLIHPRNPGFEEILQVTRDNPDLSGKIRLHADEIARVEHNDEYTPDVWHFGFGSSDTTTLLPPEVTLLVARSRDPIDDLRPESAVQSVTPLRVAKDAREGQTTEWQARTGSIGHDAAYLVQSETTHRPVLGPEVTSGSSRWYVQLSDDVLLVPVVVVVWINGTEVAGSASVQRRQAFEALRLFDFEDPGEDRFWIGASPGSIERQGTVAMEAPPDDIWSQCGIQFQVVGVITAQQELGRSCGRSALYRNFVEIVEGARGPIALHGMELLQHRMRSEPDAESRGWIQLADRVQDLDPVIYNLGIIGGCTFAGSAYAPRNLVEVDTDPYFGVARSPVTSAHELGHVLLGSESHCEEMHNKTQAECRAQGDLMVSFAQNERTIHDCDRARRKAQEMSDRFRIYRQSSMW